MSCFFLAMPQALTLPMSEVRKLWESGKHKEWDGKGPGDCYGAEHLTRMIVNLPEMIVSIPSSQVPLCQRPIRA